MKLTLSLSIQIATSNMTNIKLNENKSELHLFCSKIKLNSEVEALKLRPNGALPPFRPVILDPANPVYLPPYSMVFMIIHGINVPACSA